MAYSIIIPSRNIDNLRACVGAIRACGEASRIIVVDDGLDWSALECHGLILDWLRDNWVVVARPDTLLPFCFARNVNIGIGIAKTDDVLILNDDALLATGHGFTRIAEAAEAHQYVGVWSAAVTAPAGVGVNASHVYIPGIARTNPWRAVSKMVPFVAVYIRRDVINRVGLLDERFTGTTDAGQEVYGGEDDDFCYRARECGYKIAVHNGCVVEHGTLPSTFRPDGKGRSVDGARARFFEIHGFPMGSR